MDVKLILIILLGLFVFILIGVALHMAKTIEQMHQYIGSLRGREDAIRAVRESMEKQLRN
jgi:hypothetical protein